LFDVLDFYEQQLDAQLDAKETSDSRLT